MQTESTRLQGGNTLFPVPSEAGRSFSAGERQDLNSVFKKIPMPQPRECTAPGVNLSANYGLGR